MRLTRRNFVKLLGGCIASSSIRKLPQEIQQNENISSIPVPASTQTPVGVNSTKMKQGVFIYSDLNLIEIEFQYFPAMYERILNLIGRNTIIRIIFPDDSSLEFWGYLHGISDINCTPGISCWTARAKIVCTNYDDNQNEVAPNYYDRLIFLRTRFSLHTFRGKKKHCNFYIGNIELKLPD